MTKFLMLLRSFGVSFTATVVALVLAYIYLGPAAALLTLILVVVEITFSFENAVVNAKILMRMSRFWQQIFLTIGILIAVFGMRLVFPIVIVMLTADLSWNEVINLALNDPEEYALRLGDSHLTIAMFGGMFLLMLALHFFFDKSRKVRWLEWLERPLQRIDSQWVEVLVAIALLFVISFFVRDHQSTVLFAGLAGILTYSAIHGIAEKLIKSQHKKQLAKATGMAGFTSFIYLEILDASFSFDGVISAFAITKDVVIIAIGLGVGALWVRSLTIFMVRHHVLNSLRYLEHGAFYTVTVLATILLLSAFVHIPEIIAGLAGVTLISLAIVSSLAWRKRHKS